MKKKLPKIILILSFVPYVLFLLLCICAAIFGVDFFFSTTDGWDAFVFVFVFGGLIFSTMIPVFPVCLCIQLAYLVYGLIRKKIKINGKKFALVTGSVIVIAVSAQLIYENTYYFESLYQKHQARSMARRVDEEIPIHTNEIYCDGIFGLKQYRTAQILIDYDSAEVGFLRGSFDEYHRVKLRESDGVVDWKDVLGKRFLVQAVVPLENAPGRTLYTYSPDAANAHRTCAVILEMEDGKIWYQEEADFYTGLNSTQYSPTRER